MTKKYLALLSAVILLSYGLLTHKWQMISFGITFLLIAVANFLKKK